MTSSQHPLTNETNADALDHPGWQSPAHDQSLDRLTRLAARLFRAPVSFVFTIHGRHVRIRSSFGVGSVSFRDDVALQGTLVERIINNHGPLAMNDVAEDPELRDLAMVRDLDARASLGTPLYLENGELIGAFCVIDREPRNWSDADIAALIDLAESVLSDINLRDVRTFAEEQSEALTVQQRHDAQLLDAINQGIYSVDINGHCQFINKAGAELIGYKPEEVIGQQMHDLIHYQFPDGRPMARAECSVVHAMQSGERLRVSEHLFWKKDGSPLPVELLASPVVENGHVLGTVVTYSDISERISSDQRLRESEVRKSAILESAIDCIITSDSSLRAIELNPATEKVFGYSRDELLGMPIFETLFVEESHGALHELVNSEPAPGNMGILCQRVELVARRASGTRFPVELSIVRSTVGPEEIPILTAYIRDITNRKVAMQEIRTYENIIDHLDQAIVATDANRRITYWNQASESLFGWKREEVIGELALDISYAPEFRERARQIGQRVMKSGEAWRGELALKRRDGSHLPAIVSLAPLPDEAGNPIGLISTCTDISEIRESERRIRFFKDIVEAVGQPVVASDLNRSITFINRAAEEALGWTADEVIGKDVRQVIASSAFREQSHEIGARVREEGISLSGEFMLQRRDGSLMPALVTLAPVKNENDEIAGTIGVYTDVSTIKQAEETLQFFQDVVDAVGQAVVTTDLDRRITYWNKAAEKMLGWTAEEAIGRDILDTTPDPSLSTEAQELTRLVRSGEIVTREFTLIRRDGTMFPALINLAPLNGPSGELVGVISVYSDISDIKSTEQELRFHKRVVDSVGQAVIANHANEQRSISYWNAAAEQMLGWTAEEAIGRDVFDLLPAEGYRDQMARIGKLVRERRPWQGEILLRDKSGKTIPTIANVAPVHDQSGEPVALIATLTDISALKETEAELRFQKHIVDTVGQAIVANWMDDQRSISYWNKAAEEMLGWTAEEALGRPFYELVPDPDFIRDITHINEHVRAGRSWRGEYRVRNRENDIIPVLASVSPVFDENSELIAVIGAYADISELKTTERELLFHKHVVDAVGQAIIANALDREITYWNPAAEELLGWKAEEVLGKDSNEVAPAQDILEQVAEVGRKVRAGETWHGEFILQHRDGYPIRTLSTIKPIVDLDGDVIGVLGAHTDIRTLKETEEELRFHKHIVDAVGQAVVVSDINGNITYWNHAAEGIYGWSAGEVLGKHVADILPATHDRDLAVDVTGQVASGQTWSGEVWVKRKNGEQFPGFFTVSPITGQTGEVIGIIGVSHDISDRKQYQQQIELNTLMLDSVGQAVIATDDHLHVTFWNRGAEELFGWSSSEILGQPFLSIMPPASTGLFQTVDAIEVISRESKWSGEVVASHRDGTQITALANSSAIRDEEGRQIGLITIFADITERKRAEAELRESNQRIVEILETMGEGFISINEDWRCTYINRIGEETLQRSRGELLGRNVWDEFPGAEERQFFSRYVEAFETGEVVNFTEYYPHLGKWFEIHAYPSDGQLSVFFRDVTARQAADEALRAAEERYRTLIEQLPAMTYVASADDLSKLMYVSPQIEEVMGYTPEEWIARPDFWPDLVHPDDREMVQQEDARSLRSRDSFAIEYRQRKRDGSYIWVRDSARLIHDAEGNPRFWQGISVDITGQKQAERAVAESEQRFRSLFQNHPDGVFSIDHAGRVLSSNPAFTRLTGRSLEASPDFRFVELVVPEDRERVDDRLSRTHQGEAQEFHAGIINARGDRLEISITTIPIIVEDEIVGVHVVAQDVTLHQELENQLAHQAFHDSLTGLPNRSLFHSQLTHRINQARHRDDQFAVLFFDLDDFKIINDSLGHSAGDQLLIQVAHRVQTCIRGDDLLARLGGDEMTLLLNSVRDLQESVRVAERIASVLEEPFDLEGHEVFATTSIGIAIGDRDSTTADDILRNADLAMYEAKNAGKNRYAIFESSMNSKAWLRLTLESEIRRGINNDDFLVYFQPIVDLRTGELIKVEALVRWQHPVRGLLTPEEFISIAEQSALIIPLGRWIIENAIRQVGEWSSALPQSRKVGVSINLSARQYQHPRLIEDLAILLEEQNVDPQLITLEITESVAMDQSPSTIQTLLRLKDLGVQLALDDFGTGFSALSYLRRFPIDIIKIDRSFVDGLGTDAEDTSIIEAIMAASLTMNMHVTAEGIETPEQLLLLRNLGCHTGQGYLLSHPMTPDDVFEMLNQDQQPWQKWIAAN